MNHFPSINFSSPFSAPIDSSPWPLITEGARGVDVCAVILARTSIIFAGAVKCGTIAIDAVKSEMHCVLTTVTVTQ